MMYKTCPRCKETKPTTSFTKDSSRKSGIHPYCTDCNRIRDKIRSRTKAFKARAARSEAQYRERYPEKYSAHILSRKIPLAQACEECGKSNVKLHRHHPDYSKPLDVVTLCIECHENVHHGVTV